MRYLALALLVAGCSSGASPRRATVDPAGPAGRVEGIVRGPAGEPLADVFVCLTADLPSPPPRETEALVVMGKDGNARPRVAVLRAGQFLTIRSEGPGHGTISIEPLRNRRQIFTLTPGAELGGMPFERKEYAIPIRCSDHPDGHGWIHVAAHAFFAVTGPDGRYAIEGLPPGDRELFAWHESAPKTPQIVKTRVEAGGATALDIAFKPGRAK